VRVLRLTLLKPNWSPVEQKTITHCIVRIYVLQKRVSIIKRD